MRWSAFAVMILAILAAGPSLAQQGGAAAGEKVFNRCKACHEVETDRHKIGPSLAGVMGKTAGTHEGYRYSNAMVEAGQSGLVWDDEALAEYLKNPRQTVKGTKMAFAGLKKEQELADVIAYLKQFSEPR